MTEYSIRQDQRLVERRGERRPSPFALGSRTREVLKALVTGSMSNYELYDAFPTENASTLRGVAYRLVTYGLASRDEEYLTYSITAAGRNYLDVLAGGERREAVLRSRSAAHVVLSPAAAPPPLAPPPPPPGSILPVKEEMKIQEIHEENEAGRNEVVERKCTAVVRKCTVVSRELAAVSQKLIETSPSQPLLAGHGGFGAGISLKPPWGTTIDQQFQPVDADPSRRGRGERLDGPPPPVHPHPHPPAAPSKVFRALSPEEKEHVLDALVSWRTQCKPTLQEVKVVSTMLMDCCIYSDAPWNQKLFSSREEAAGYFDLPPDEFDYAISRLRERRIAYYREDGRQRKVGVYLSWLDLLRIGRWS